MNVIAYTAADGSLRVVVPMAKEKKADENEADFVARIRAKDVPSDATDVVELNRSEIPQDREFRNAWKRGAATEIEVDLEKAKTIQEQRIHNAKLRKARELLEREMVGEDITLEKAKLQAIDKTIVRTATSIDDLKALWPISLPRTK